MIVLNQNIENFIKEEEPQNEIQNAPILILMKKIKRKHLLSNNKISANENDKYKQMKLLSLLHKSVSKIIMKQLIMI